MNPENTEKLLTTYPLLYRELRERSFECGDGWFDLVWQVSAEIESAAQLEGIPKTAEAWPSVGILKQKFGALRVQFRTRVGEAIEAVVAKASRLKSCHMAARWPLPCVQRDTPTCGTCLKDDWTTRNISVSGE